MTNLYSRPIRAEINLAAIRHNIVVAKTLASRKGSNVRLMAVVKANAYGHGMLPVSKAIQDSVDEFAVASIDDAYELRESGITCPITALSSVFSEQGVLYANKRNVDLVVYDHAQLKELSRLNAQLTNVQRVWLKFDTGMGRLGFNSEEHDELGRQIDLLSNIEIRGIMSHLSSSDEPSREENALQLNEFLSLIEESDGLEASLSNSGAIVSMPEASFDIVRPGLMLYGCSPTEGVSAQQLDLQAVMTLKSELISVAKLKQGDAVGYGGMWLAPEDMSYGVVACGYGDGYPRAAGNYIDNNDGAFVVIANKQVPIIGRISMDLIAVDLREVDAKVGDDVILWGEDLPVDSIARLAGTIPYELLCGVTSRVKRVYIDSAAKLSES